MVERNQRTNASREQLIYQAAVKIKALGIWLAAAVRLDTSPRHGKTVAVQIQRAH